VISGELNTGAGTLRLDLSAQAVAGTVPGGAVEATDGIGLRWLASEGGFAGGTSITFGVTNSGQLGSGPRLTSSTGPTDWLSGPGTTPADPWTAVPISLA